jgi:hypothetical protein
MEDVKTWYSSQASDSFDTGIKKLISREKCLIQAVNTLRSSLIMYVFFVYDNCFSHSLFRLQFTGGYSPNSSCILSLQSLGHKHVPFERISGFFPY